MGLESPSQQQIAVESWTFYSIGLLLIICRLYSRSLVVGSFKRLQIDDYIMCFDAVMYTLLMVGINLSSQSATNLYPPDLYDTFTEKDIKDRIYGSKLVILLEQSMLICTWTTKSCMLLMYNRITARLWHERAIQLIAVYVILGFIACELAWFLSCRPFHGYWAMPVPDAQCATYQHYSIVQAVFNISSDAMMLGVAVPLVAKAKVPPKKKILLVGVFSLGIFVILAAVLNKYYNFSNPLTTIYMLWYIREASVAIYVANIPLLWPMFRRVLNVGSFLGKTSNYGSGYPSSNQKSRSRASRITLGKNGPAIGIAVDGEELAPYSPRKGHAATVVESNHSYSGSEERIVNVKNSGEYSEPLQITTRMSFHVDEGQSAEGSLQNLSNTYDVERYGGAKYKASVTAGPLAAEHPGTS